MSNIQRATIFFLVITALAVWVLGLRAALRPGARADQEPTATPAVVETPAEPTPTKTTRPSATPTPSPEPTASETPVATATFSPTATVSPTSTPSPSATASSTSTPSPSATASSTSTPSPSATPTQEPSPSPSPTATATKRPVPTPLPSRTGTPNIPKTGRSLLVDQDKQVMYAYENGIEIRTIPVSTGRPVENAFTPAWRGDVGRYWGGGPFLDTDLYSDYMWYLFPGARGSILIHSLPYSWDGDEKIYEQPDALGVEPASHGCVRISPEDALWLKRWNPVGVPIEITPWSGEIGPPDESL